MTTLFGCFLFFLGVLAGAVCTVVIIAQIRQPGARRFQPTVHVTEICNGIITRSAFMGVRCPKCDHHFCVDENGLAQDIELHGPRTNENR